MKKVRLVLLIFLISSVSADPVTNAQLTKININILAQLAEFKKLYEIVVQELEQLQATADSLNDMNNIYKELKYQRDAVEKFGDIDTWKKRFALNLQRLNDLDGIDDPNASLEDKLNIISKAIDNRIMNTNGDDRSWLITQKALFDAQAIINDLKDDSGKPAEISDVSDAINVKQYTEKELETYQAYRALPKAIKSSIRGYQR